MNNFNSARRDLLRMGISGVGAAALLPALGMAAEKSSMAGPANTAAGQYLFDVRKYGAAGDGKTIDTPAINKAIEAAATDGGTVLFPAGTYMCFSIRLKSRVHLYLSQGAQIVGADSPRPGQSTGYDGGMYDAAEPNPKADHYEDYGHRHWHNSLIWADGEHDMSITGPGQIYGKGLSNGTMGSRGGYPIFDQKQKGVADKAIAMKNCHNVIMRDFSILKGGHFGLLLTGVDNLTIDNVTIDTDRDGMDLDCCQNVRVANCTVNSPWDDGICPKSSYALGYRRPCKNFTIANCWVTGHYQIGAVLDGTFKEFPSGQRHIPHNGRIKCGTESNGGFINFTITGCVIEGSLGYALESVDGANLEDITISNTTMREIFSGALFFRLGARLRGPKESTEVGTMKRILISNLDCYGSSGRQASILSGIPGYTIDDVKLDNIYIETAGGGTAEQAKIQVPELVHGYPEPGRFGPTPSSGFFLRHMRNLEMSHVEIANGASDARPAFYLDDVDRADFFAITAPPNAGNSFSLHNVKDFRIGWSRAAADATLSSAGNKTL